MALVAPSSTWLPADAVDAISRAQGEPAEWREYRRKAHRAFVELPLEPNPLYRKYGYFGGVDLTGLDALARGSAVASPPLPEDTVQVLHDASGTRIELSGSVRDAGVSAIPLERLASGADGTGFLRTDEPPGDRLIALAAATMNRGYRLVIPDRCPVPVRLREFAVLSAPHEGLSVRRQLNVGRGSHLLVTEEVYSTPGPAETTQRLYGSDTELQVGADARVGVLSVHAPDLRAVAIYRRQATVDARAKLAWLWAGFGGFRTRIRNRSLLPGQAANLTDLQMFFGVDDQHFDSAVDLVHVGTDTHGQSISRGVFRDRARGMSRGLVRIEKDARKTLSYLSEHAMLLSQGARSDTIPILEILCRDVKATHSSSVAPVDPERVFYLESRGIPADRAIRMIAEGFLSNVLERAPVAGLREFAYPLLDARWEGRSIPWGPEELPALPALSLTGTESDTDWRFDAKLR
jgi:Fe-S cluster assembly scaffold protein SufB